MEQSSISLIQQYLLYLQYSLIILGFILFYDLYIAMDGTLRMCQLSLISQNLVPAATTCVVYC